MGIELTLKGPKAALSRKSDCAEITNLCTFHSRDPHLIVKSWSSVLSLHLNLNDQLHVYTYLNQAHSDIL